MGVFGLLTLQRVDELEKELNRLKKEQGSTDQSEHNTDEMHEMQITESDMKAFFAAIVCVVGVALIVGVGLVLWSTLH